MVYRNFRNGFGMYKEFFGLQKLPFNLTPDPAFLFLPAKHREALAGLTYSILERKGFIVLTGDAGTGKTTLLSSVLNILPSDRIQSSVILNPTLTPSEFLEMVLLDFDISDVPASKAQRLWKLQEFLSRAARQGKVALLVIDEAHKLSSEVLEEIRLLGNYESATDKFLQILLLGQSELDDLLNRQDLRQFKQRIALRLYIDPLNALEAEKYIRFRWVKAGGGEISPFAPDAVSGVYQWSRGIPRLINSICDNALLMAYGEKSHSVGLKFVREAATNLALVDGHSLPSVVPRPVAAPALPESHIKPAANPNSLLDLHHDNHLIPNLGPYDAPRTNSSLLKRLAGKFGI
jgi:general secretion pathway protein A